MLNSKNILEKKEVIQEMFFSLTTNTNTDLVSYLETNTIQYIDNISILSSLLKILDNEITSELMQIIIKDSFLIEIFVNRINVLDEEDWIFVKEQLQITYKKIYPRLAEMNLDLVDRNFLHINQSLLEDIYFSLSPIQKLDMSEGIFKHIFA